MKSNSLFKSIIVITTFLFSFYGLSLFYDTIALLHINKYIFQYLFWLIPSLLVCGFLFNFIKIPENLGLNRNISKAFVFSIIVVSPMLISSFVMGVFNQELTCTTIFKASIGAGIMEEYLFRGFLFGLLFRKLKWGFIPAALIGSIFFGAGHIYQGTEFWQTLGIFAITATGAAWFAWLYIEWNSNLWIPIFMHTLMNLSWILFDISNNALGNVYSNIFRAITIAISIIITIYYHKQRGLLVNKRNLIINKK